MNKIKVEFHRTDNFVYGRVLEMPDELRYSGIIISKGGYSLESLYTPGISCNGQDLFLRGKEIDEDNNWFSNEYETIEKAKEAIAAFQNLIEEWNGKNIDILDEKEREYLSTVIAPFKNRRNIKIIKRRGIDLEFIHVEMKTKLPTMNEPIINEYIQFPYFETGAMYKGMEPGKEYSLKELKLV